MKKIALTFSLFIVLSASLSRADLITDGTFSNATSGTYLYNNPYPSLFSLVPNPNGNSNFFDPSGTGWSVANNTVSVGVDDGIHYVLLNGPGLLSINLGSGGTIAETINGLTAGTNYTLNFDTVAFGLLNLQALGSSGVQVSISGATNLSTTSAFQPTLLTANLLSPPQLNAETLSFTATGSSSVIQLAETGSLANLTSGGGLAVTNLSLNQTQTPVPEPGESVSLVMLFVGGLFVLRSALNQRTLVGD